MMQWHEIEAWAKEKLSMARDRNDGELDAVQTAKLRGRIETLKELIALPEALEQLKAQSKFVKRKDDEF